MSPAEPVTTSTLRLRPGRTGRLEALLLAAGPHLEPVLDIGTATNGDLLVVLPEPAARLPELLEAPGALTAGESVTVLVPLVQALARMHEVGVAHGGVRAAAVVLDAEGSPSWTSPVSPVLRRAVGPERFADRVAEDLAGLEALGLALLGPAFPVAAPEDLVAALFRVARPEPVRLVRPPVDPFAGPPGRLVAAALLAPAPVPAGDRPDVRVAMAERLGPVRRWLGSVRPRVWALLGTVAALLVAAGLLLPSGAPAAEPTPSASVRSTVRAGAPPAPVADPTAPAASAVAALLAARARCLQRGSEACLRTVDAVDSPVLDADLRAVRSGADAVEVGAEGLRVTATGGTAVATSARGTVLAIRDRNGWRLRDVVAEPPAG